MQVPPESGVCDPLDDPIKISSDVHNLISLTYDVEPAPEVGSKF